MYTGERQVSTLRKKYLEAVLKQDVGFFDTDARTGDIVFSVSTDTLLVQDAISEKVLNFNLQSLYIFIYEAPDIYIEHDIDTDNNFLKNGINYICHCWCTISTRARH